MFHRIRFAIVLTALVTLGAASASATDTGIPDPPAGDVAAQLKKLRDEVAELRISMALRDKAATLEYKMLSARLTAIEDSLKELAARPSVTTTESKKALSVVTDTTGNMRLVNRLAVTAEVRVGSRTYTVEPLSERTVEGRPVGGFSYEVTADGMGVTSRKRAVIEAGRTWVLTIF